MSPAARLIEADLALLSGGNYANVVTLNPDGSPHPTVVWIDADDEHVLLNTAQGRVKDRNLRRDPRVGVTVVLGSDWYRWVAVSGEAVERRTGPEADAHIDVLSRRYDGTPWSPTPGQVRVLYVIRPGHITRYPR